MYSLSATRKKTQDVLDEILAIIRDDCENANSALSETDRIQFVEGEKSLRNRLEAIVESEPDDRWIQKIFARSPSQAAKCLEEAQELRQRIKRDIHTKRRAKSFESNALGLFFNSTGTIMTDAGWPVDGITGHPGAVASPINTPRGSISKGAEPNNGSVDESGRDYTADLNEAIQTPLEVSQGNSSTGNIPSPRPRRRAPPPPPLLSRPAPSGVPPRRSASVRRPAPPPPLSPRSSRQSRTSNPPTMQSNPIPPEVFASIMSFANSMTKQAQAQQKINGKLGHVVKTNCIDINGSVVEGLTLNNGSQNCSGAVIHKTALPAHRV